MRREDACRRPPAGRNRLAVPRTRAIWSGARLHAGGCATTRGRHPLRLHPLPARDSCYCRLPGALPAADGHRADRLAGRGDAGPLPGRLRCAQGNITRLVEAVSQEARRIRRGEDLGAVFSDYPTAAAAWPGLGAVGGARLPGLRLPDGLQQQRPGLRAHGGGQLGWCRAASRSTRHRASAPGLPPEQVIWQAQLARDAGAPGFIIFNYDRRVATQPPAGAARGRDAVRPGRLGNWHPPAVSAIIMVGARPRLRDLPICRSADWDGSSPGCVGWTLPARRVSQQHRTKPREPFSVRFRAFRWQGGPWPWR